MKIPKLQAVKVQQAIKRNGVAYSFDRAKTDKFDQPVLDKDGNPVVEEVCIVKGIFHETGTGFVLITSDAAQVQSKPTPSVLAMLKDTKTLKINDAVFIPPNGSISYKVVSVNNIGNIDLFADIALEVIADGTEV